ncbi:MAG: hypothetical protein AAGD47_08510 [Pseudomonadota bacterium]
MLASSFKTTSTLIDTHRVSTSIKRILNRVVVESASGTRAVFYDGESRVFVNGKWVCGVDCPSFDCESEGRAWLKQTNA